MVLEKTFDSSLDSKEIQPVYPKGNQSRLCIGRADVEAEAPILWPPDRRADSFVKTMEYYSAIKNNAFESVLMRWMKLELTM